jgi:hypothetical protein
MQNDNDEQQFVTIYILVHFVIGMIAGYLGIPFVLWVFIHVLFELWESTKSGIKFFAAGDKILKEWLGASWPTYSGDHIINSILDTLSSMAGWGVADYLLKKC